MVVIAYQASFITIMDSFTNSKVTKHEQALTTTSNSIQLIDLPTNTQVAIKMLDLKQTFLTVNAHTFPLTLIYTFLD